VIETLRGRAAQESLVDRIRSRPWEWDSQQLDAHALCDLIQWRPELGVIISNQIFRSCWLLSQRVLMNTVKAYHPETRHPVLISDEQSSQHSINGSWPELKFCTMHEEFERTVGWAEAVGSDGLYECISFV
jgi:hypothetical protein